MKIAGLHYQDYLGIALATMRDNKLRSCLTLVGVTLGVWAVMAIASVISGIDLAVKEQVEAFGARSIFITRTPAEARLGDLSRPGRPLTLDDVAAIQGLPAVEVAVPILDISNTYFGAKLLVGRGEKASAAVRLMGTLPDYARASGSEVITEGRFFTDAENAGGQEVCVISASVADNFFLSASPIGEALEIGGRQFRVLGVVEDRKQILGGAQESLVYLPFDTARRLRPNAEETLILAVAHEGRLEQAKEEIGNLLRGRRRVAIGGDDNFGLATADSIIETFRSLTFSIAAAMIVVSSIGLLVGGIGVMNIMLVSVTERTKEIGLRKAVGARRRDILWQFIIEAVTLTGAGGLLGLIAGWLTTLLIRLALPSYVPLWAPLLGFLMSLGVGVIFGAWPAWEAARLDPIEALRFE